jgi:hypothetical protein
MRRATKGIEILSYEATDKLVTAWWASLESNRGPQSYQDCALTN